MSALHKPTRRMSAARTVLLLASMLAWLLAILLAWPWIVAPAQAAESYDNCSGYIDSVPAVIATQGTWCLRKDLSTAQTSGNAIEIAANNVTLDCNDFKIGGLSAGIDSMTNGIVAEDRQNVTVRNCNIRGFFEGIYLSGGGHVVEDNRLDHNLYTGIDVTGGRSLVRRNRVFDTGGTTSDDSYVSGISAGADIIDNVVDGVSTDGRSHAIFGILGFGSQARISGNRVGGLKFTGDGVIAFGIRAWDETEQAIVGNRVTATVANTNGYGIRGNPSGRVLCVGNTIANFETALDNCASPVGAANDSL